jgi:hypothetical protein
MILQEEVTSKCVALIFRGTKLTFRILGKGVGTLNRTVRNKKNAPKIGKQTYDRLSKRGDGLTTVEITDDNIKAFDPIARKYHIGYSLKRDDSSSPPKWVVFFKSKDTDMLTLAFKELTEKAMVDKGEKKSVLEKVRAVTEKVSDKARTREKDRERSGPSL